MFQILIFLVSMILIGSGVIGSDAFLIGLFMALILMWIGYYLVCKKYKEDEKKK